MTHFYASQPTSTIVRRLRVNPTTHDWLRLSWTCPWPSKIFPSCESPIKLGKTDLPGLRNTLVQKNYKSISAKNYASDRSTPALRRFLSPINPSDWQDTVIGISWGTLRNEPQHEKICKSQRTNQCHSLRTLYWFVLCNLLIFSGCVCHLEQLHAQSPFLFPIVFSINLTPFFDMCSVDYLLFFHPGCSGMCCFTHGALLGPLRSHNSCCLWFWQQVFGVSLRAATSNLPSPPTLSQTEVCSAMGESIRPSSFHNPTLSANKQVVQICRSSLSAALQTVQVSVELVTLKVKTRPSWNFSISFPDIATSFPWHYGPPPTRGAQSRYAAFGSFAPHTVCLRRLFWYRHPRWDQLLPARVEFTILIPSLLSFLFVICDSENRVAMRKWRSICKPYMHDHSRIQRDIDWCHRCLSLSLSTTHKSHWRTI